MPFAKVKKGRIFYDDYGKENNKDVLFIHGLGSSSIAWRDIPYALSESGGDFHTIALDLIGFGKSDKPDTADYTMKGFSKFIKDFLTQGIGINENKKISLVGHSLGGYIAAEFAIENKHIIEKLVLIDSSGMLKEPTPLLKRYLDAEKEEDSVLKYDKVKKTFEDMYLLSSSLLPLVIGAFLDTIGKPGAKNAFEIAFHDSTSKQIDRLEVIQDIPCLVIWGKYDNLIPLGHADIFKDKFTNAQLEIIDYAGHAPFVERTALVYEKVRTFLMK
jgi:pimeloyl-ACP methyl ester carboxylesterase